MSLLVFQGLGNYADGGFVSTAFFSFEFYLWLSAYAAIIIVSILNPTWQSRENDLPSAWVVVDITMIMWLVYIAGGINSGLGVLVLPFVVTSCLISAGRYPLLYGSYTTMLLLVNLLANGDMQGSPASWNVTAVVMAAFLSGASFLVAALTAFLASYLQEATESANENQQAYRRVSGLNRLVLNRVQEAVVVLDTEQTVWLFNRQAKTYFPDLEIDRQHNVFGELIEQWQQQPDRVFEIDIHIYQHAMHVRAVPLIQEDTELLMLYIRSLREVAAEVMSTKLASLGQLTANLAHEIRNPMSAIRHANDLLQEDDMDPTKVKLHNIIDSNIGRIDKMLEDISLINKRDSLSKETVNIMKFWLAFKQEFILNNPAASGCIHLNMERSNLSVAVDSMHLQQIMWNLCNNAWRHSKKDAQAIMIAVKASGRMHVSILVMDSGMGVPPDIRTRLFEPFFTTEKRGTGLGLYVARELAHANMGQLHYHPEMNGFELILPRDYNE
ncbi:two component sensor kinase [Neisseria weaveri ATCC 51223]|nr:two component sensor kinase [Neisseria weaveri ATCC 51223]